MTKVNHFSQEERERYSRHFVLPQFGESAQQKLLQSRVAVVGAGGLGCPVLQYLVAAGVGHIAIFDHDNVSLSNLQRQILYTAADLNQPKAQVAAEKLRALNQHVQIDPFVNQLNTSNALGLLKGFQLIIDCTDNFPTRYLLNDASVLLDIPLIYASIYRYEGQVAVFNYQRSANYRDLYPLPPRPEAVTNCEEGGVLGALAGIIGSMQANEAIKVLAGIGDPLVNRLLVFDSLTMDSQIIQIANKNERKNILGLIDYDDFCNAPKKPTDMKEVTVQELKALKDSKANFQLIDVREPHEFDICNLDGELIPQAEIPHNVDKIAKDKQVVIHCRSGARSGNMVKWLESNHGFTNLYNLKGGILAWAKEIDTSMPTY
ncbi:MAG: molybdopterin-synthase adenylyltransferase MoeB [Bacteroidota bacterium]|jgi:molybdopterin/thiamine biosynthesis adenylyltransferase/rhodanese-related sulfurtransferase|nr:molybdopterin-synthase adenylyltransferase MoeB [Cytophagales bacterium]